MEAIVLQIDANVTGVKKLVRRAIVFAEGKKITIPLSLPEYEKVHAGDKITLSEESMELEEKLA